MYKFVRQTVIMLLSIMMIVPTLGTAAYASEDLSYVKAIQQISAVTSEGKELEILEGTEFFSTRTETGSYRIVLNDTYVELNEEDVEVIDQPESTVFINETELAKQILPKGTVLTEDGKEAVILLSDTELSTDKEGKQAVIGNQFYQLSANPAGQTEDDEPEAEEDTGLSEQVSLSFSDEKTFTAAADNASFYTKNQEGELIKQGELTPGVPLKLSKEYGNWLVFQYGGEKAYVWKAAAKPAAEEELEGEPVPDEVGTPFEAVEDIPLYIQSSGEQVEIAFLAKGAKSHYISTEGKWLNVYFAGRFAMVEKDAVNADSMAAASQSDSDYIEVVLDNTSFYSNEGGSLTKLGQIQKGEIYKKVRDLGNWYEVSVAGKQAYVWKKAVSPSPKAAVPYLEEAGSQELELSSDAKAYDNSSGSLIEIGLLLKGQKLKYISKAGNWYIIEMLGRKAYIHDSAVSISFKETDHYFKVNQENVSIVVNNGGTLEPRGILSKGQVFKRRGDAGNWHIIDVAGTTMYVWKKATNPAADNIPDGSAGSRKLTLELDATVYDNSTGSLVPITVLNKNHSFTYIEKLGNWYKVNIAGRMGYIHKDAVQLDFEDGDRYFEVLQDRVPVVKNENGTLVDVGYLVKGQTYERVKDYGSWHLVEFGKTQGFVWEDATAPYRDSDLPIMSGSSSESVTFTALKPLSVYDNSSGELIQIGEIKEGSVFGVVSQMGNWYEVNFSGRKAYVYAPATGLNASRVVNARERVYTYEEMVGDLKEMARMYPDFTELTTIGKSVDGRDIYAMKLGKGSKEVLVDASTHAREHMTTNIVMTMLDNYAYSYATNQLFQGMNVKRILDETSIWFVPMVNPDGVTLVQKGHTSAKNPQEVLRINNLSTNFTSWKANIKGVDINRQFPADWDNITNNTGRPSNKNYKGVAPLTEPEAQAVANFILSYDFKAFASYHSSGEILYWHFNQVKNYARDYALARKLSNITGYPLVSPDYGPGGSGASQDWFIRQVGKPGFTIEISPHVVEREVPLYYFDRIWNQNKTIGLVVADEAKNY
ncbi:M14 family zinc carboxypeptidase [Bacillus sp. AK031]